MAFNTIGGSLVVDDAGVLYWDDECCCGTAPLTTCQEFADSDGYATPGTAQVTLLWNWVRPLAHLQPNPAGICESDCPDPPPLVYTVPFSNKSGGSNPYVHWQNTDTGNPDYTCIHYTYDLFSEAHVGCVDSTKMFTMYGGFTTWDWNGFFDTDTIEWGKLYTLYSDTGNWGYDVFNRGCWVPDLPISATVVPVATLQL